MTDRFQIMLLEHRKTIGAMTVELTKVIVMVYVKWMLCLPCNLLMAVIKPDYKAEDKPLQC